MSPTHSKGSPPPPFKVENPQGLVAGSLARHLENYKQFKQFSEWHLDIIRNGLKIPFVSEPPPIDLPNRPLSPEDQEFADSEISRLLLLNAISEVQS